MSDQPLESDVYGRVAARLGGEVADAFCKAFGGREVFVAIKPKASGQIAAAMGLEAAQAIYEEFGCGRLLVPMRQYATGRQRRLAVAELLKSGTASNTEIAAALQVHRRTVERVKAALRREGRLK